MHAGAPDCETMTAARNLTFSLRPEGGGPELLKLAPGTSITLGRDAGNGAQIGHGSIEPFHARLRCDDWGVWITPMAGASVVVAGEATHEERVIPLGASVELGSLRFELAAAEASPPARGGRGLRQALSHAAAMVVSALLHVVAIWVLHRLSSARELEREALALHSDLVAPPPEEMVEASAPTPTEPMLEAEVIPEIEPLDALPAPDPDPDDVRATSLAGGLEALDAPLRVGLGPAAGAGSLTGAGTLSLDDTTGLSRGFVSRLKALRGTGVDLVLVIDATSSMRPFLEGARTAIDTLVSALATVVADLRVGVVAYRDAGDEFQTRVLPLSGDRYSILNFVWSLRAEGGGDVPEAVAAGLEAAVGTMGWRARTHRVIVVVGDAPPHAGDWPRLKSVVGRFARGETIPGAVVSAIYTGAPRDRVIDPAEDGAAALAEIARLGRGDYLDLGGYAQVADRLLLLTLGPRHAEEVRTLLTRVKDGPREKLIQARVVEGDRTWLLAKLRRPPVHPAVVEALVDLADRGILWSARELIADRASPREAREAALYLLRRCVPQAGEIDLGRDLADQQGLLNRLDALILRR